LVPKGVKSRTESVSETKLTTRDSEILDTLTQRVRVLTLDQVARTWWAAVAQPEAGAQRRLRELERAGWVHNFTVVAHPEIPLLHPVASWHPGAVSPDFSTIAYELRSRWRLSVTPVNCVIASTKAGRHFGGHGGRFPRQTEQTHDIHLAAVYLHIRSATPHLARHWESEAEIVEQRGNVSEKLPDAILALPTGKRVIEFGGAYAKEKLQAFHQYCAQNELPYEVW
jgi:hypothetical protein